MGGERGNVYSRPSLHFWKLWKLYPRGFWTVYAVRVETGICLARTSVFHGRSHWDKPFSLTFCSVEKLQFFEVRCHTCQILLNLEAWVKLPSSRRTLGHHFQISRVMSNSAVHLQASRKELVFQCLLKSLKRYRDQFMRLPRLQREVVTLKLWYLKGPSSMTFHLEPGNYQRVQQRIHMPQPMKAPTKGMRESQFLVQ